MLQLNKKNAENSILCYGYSNQTTTQTERSFRMITITHDMRFRLSLIRYADKHGVSKAARVYKTNRHGYSRSITGLWRVLKRLELSPVKPPNPKYIPRPYEQMLYPGQRVQIDVKHVPSACIVGDAEGQKFYQYTAIDEFSRFRYIEAFSEASTYTSAQFLKNMIAAFPFKVECVQTDNGFEFYKTIRFLQTGA